MSCGGSGGFEGYSGYNTSAISLHNTPVGVSGRILTPPLPALCSSGRPGDLFTMSWVMLADTSTGGLAQAGIVVEIGGAGVAHPSCATTFYEWHHSSSSGFTAPGGGRVDGYPNCATTGSRHTFRVLSVGTDVPSQGNNRLVLQVGPQSGTPATVYQTQWSTDSWTHIVPQFNSETSNSGADIFGKTSSHAVLYNLGIQSADGSGLIPLPCYMVQSNSAPRGNVTASSCQQFDTWSS